MSGIDRNVRKALAALDLGDKPSSYSEVVDIALQRLLEVGAAGLEALVDEQYAQLDLAKRQKTKSCRRGATRNQKLTRWA